MTYQIVTFFFLLMDQIAKYGESVLPDLVIRIFEAGGRLAFPLFAYAVIIELRRTERPLRYWARIALIAFATQVAIFLIALLTPAPFRVNLLVTLTLGIAAIIGADLLFSAILGHVPARRDGLGRVWRTLTGTEADYALLYRGTPPYLGTAEEAGARPLTLGAETVFRRRARWFPMLLAGAKPLQAALLGVALLLLAWFTTVWVGAPLGHYAGWTMLLFYGLHITTAYPDPRTPYRQRVRRRRTFFLAFLLLNFLYNVVTYFEGGAWDARMIQNVAILAPLLFGMAPAGKPPRHPLARHFLLWSYPVLHVFFLLINEMIHAYG